MEHLLLSCGEACHQAILWWLHGIIHCGYSLFSTRSKTNNITMSSGQQQQQGREIHLDTMSLQELSELGEEQRERLQALGQRLAVLRQAAARLSSGLAAVEDLAQAQPGDWMLVPLTESVYVPGRLQAPRSLLVELGTGYYADMSDKEAAAFLSRKERLIDANSANISSAMQATRSNIEAIQATMQGKMLEIRAKQEGVRHRTAVEG